MTIDARPGAMDMADDDDVGAGDGGWGDDDELVGDEDEDGAGGAGSDGEKGAGWGDSDDDLDLPPDVGASDTAGAFAGGDDADGFYVPPTKGVSQAQVGHFHPLILLCRSSTGSFASHNSTILICIFLSSIWILCGF